MFAHFQSCLPLSPRVGVYICQYGACILAHNRNKYKTAFLVGLTEHGHPWDHEGGQSPRSRWEETVRKQLSLRVVGLRSIEQAHIPEPRQRNR